MPTAEIAPPQPADYFGKLLQLGQLMNSSLELKQVLETAIEQVIQFVGAERGFILLVDTETGRVWGEAVRNMERSALEESLSADLERTDMEISRSIVENVLDTRSPVVSVDAMEDPRFAARQSVQLRNLRSVLCVPLVAQGRLLGVIYLDNRMQAGVFASQHLDMLTAFSNQAAVAIQNARLYENLRRSLDERLRLQDALNVQEMQRLALEEASRLKTDFIGFVAHELRNPLTAIAGYVQTMLADTEGTLDAATRQEFLQSIEADADRLLDMIQELLDVSRLEAGRPLMLALGPVDLRDLLARVTRPVRYDRYLTAAHKLELNIRPGVPDQILGDGPKLAQVLSNLVSNAIKYSPSGGVVKLTAETDASGDVCVSVSDEGVGLTPEQKSRLFRQYERVEREEIKNIRGTGLGLYLVKHIVDLHGGHIEVESAPGRGSTFRVCLPSSGAPE